MPGETLVFELRWGVIPAGKAVLEVKPNETINGQPAYHFVLTAKSNSFLDIFYKVRDRIDSYTNTDLTQTLHYKKKQHEGSTRRNIQVDFDWEKKQAVYQNHRKKKPHIDLQSGALDPLGAFYFIRKINLTEKLTFERPVTDGKKCVMGRARVIKRETLKLALGTFDTYLIEPELKDIGGVFKKSRDAKIRLWITADHRRIPVKLQSKVVVGSFVGELVKMRNTSP